MAKLILATYESLTRPGVVYELSFDDYKKQTKCSCPGSRYYGHCKHLTLFKKGMLPKENVILTLMGAIKFPNLNKIYKTI